MLHTAHHSSQDWADTSVLMAAISLICEVDKLCILTLVLVKVNFGSPNFGFSKEYFVTTFNIRRKVFGTVFNILSVIDKLKMFISNSVSNVQVVHFLKL